MTVPVVNGTWLSRSGAGRITEFTVTARDADGRQVARAGPGFVVCYRLPDGRRLSEQHVQPVTSCPAAVAWP